MLAPRWHFLIDAGAMLRHVGGKIATKSAKMSFQQFSEAVLGASGAVEVGQGGSTVAEDAGSAPEAGPVELKLRYFAKLSIKTSSTPCNLQRRCGGFTGYRLCRRPFQNSTVGRPQQSLSYLNS